MVFGFTSVLEVVAGVEDRSVILPVLLQVLVLAHLTTIIITAKFTTTATTTITLLTTSYYLRLTHFLVVCCRVDRHHGVNLGLVVRLTLILSPSSGPTWPNPLLHCNLVVYFRLPLMTLGRVSLVFIKYSHCYFSARPTATNAAHCVLTIMVFERYVYMFIYIYVYIFTICI